MKRVALSLCLVVVGLKPLNLNANQIFCTDEETYELALRAIDHKSYAMALELFTKLSPAFQKRSDVIENWAGAFVGDCGVHWTTIYNSLGSGHPLLETLLEEQASDVVNPESCRLGLTKMEELGRTPKDRTPSQNLFMMIAALGKISALIHNDADIDGRRNHGDGQKDEGFNACQHHEFPVPVGSPPSTNGGDGTFSIDELNQIITGFGVMLENFQHIRNKLNDNVVRELDKIDRDCSRLDRNPCKVTTRSEITALDRFTMAQILHSGRNTTEIQIGIGTCSGSLINCCGQ